MVKFWFVVTELMDVQSMPIILRNVGLEIRKRTFYNCSVIYSEKKLSRVT